MLKLLSKIYDKKNPPKLFLASYITLIILGALILMLPISSQARQFTNPVDAFFTATSAICVTGLVRVTTASYWSAFGKVVIILMIQLGGLGIVTAAGAFGLLLNKRFSVRDRMHLAEEKSAMSLGGLAVLLKDVIYITFGIELFFALILSFSFVPTYGWARGIGYAIWHSISAFCNAGFDILGPDSLEPYSSNALVMLSIMGLIVTGGLGFGVYHDLFEGGKLKKFSKLRLHSKIVLVMTGILIFGSAFIILVVEWSNPLTLGKMSFGDKILNALFQSVTTRTAGFYSMSQAGLKNASTVLVYVLMVIGGSPAGTAGGIKTTTVAVLGLVTLSNIRRQKDVSVFNRRLPQDLIKKAMSIFVLVVIWCFLAIFILTITEADIALIDIMFEVFSALGTVGLTRGITPGLSAIGSLVIMATMVLGKLGPLSMVYAFTRKKEKPYREAEETIIVG